MPVARPAYAMLELLLDAGPELLLEGDTDPGRVAVAQQTCKIARRRLRGERSRARPPEPMDEWLELRVLYARSDARARRIVASGEELRVGLLLDHAVIDPEQLATMLRSSVELGRGISAALAELPADLAPLEQLARSLAADPASQRHPDALDPPSHDLHDVAEHLAAAAELRRTGDEPGCLASLTQARTRLTDHLETWLAQLERLRLERDTDADGVLAVLLDALTGNRAQDGPAADSAGDPEAHRRGPPEDHPPEHTPGPHEQLVTALLAMPGAPQHHLREATPTLWVAPRETLAA